MFRKSYIHHQEDYIVHFSITGVLISP